MPSEKRIVVYEAMNIVKRISKHKRMNKSQKYIATSKALRVCYDINDLSSQMTQKMNLKK